MRLARCALLLSACSAPLPPEGAEDTEERPPYEFQSAETCGVCHPTQFDEWQQSMHAYAAVSPVFDAMASEAFRETGGSIGTFCTKCHAPIGTAAGEGGETTAATRSALSREGVSCDYCHVTVDHNGTIGNNNLIRGSGGTKYGSITDPEGAAPHNARYGEFITSSEMCGGCHEVFRFPVLQLEQTYTEHREGPASEVRCQDCHMGPEPGVPGPRRWGPAAVVDGVPSPVRALSSHRMIGPDHALIDGFPYPDDPGASAAARAEHLQQAEALLRRGIEITDATAERTDAGVVLSVTVTSLTDGHRVPTGVTAERQLWLAVTATSAGGERVYASGDLDADGNLRDDHSAAVCSGAVEPDVDLFNLQSTHWGPGQEEGDCSVPFSFEATTIQRNSLMPREARVVTYALPNEADTVEVTLRYRSMPPYILQVLGLEALTERLHVFTVDHRQMVVGEKTELK